MSNWRAGASERERSARVGDVELQKQSGGGVYFGSECPKWNSGLCSRTKFSWFVAAREVTQVTRAQYQVGVLIVALLARVGWASSSAITISTLSRDSAAPFQSLTISGSGFDPSAQTNVTFSNNDDYSVTVPTFLVTSTAIMVTVPPFFDQEGALAGGTVDVTVSQVYGSRAVTSNVLPGFKIQPPPELSSETPPGSLSLALLESLLQANTSMRAIILGTTFDTPPTQKTLNNQISTLQSVIPQLKLVVSGAKSSLSIGQLNGTDVIVDRPALRDADRLILSAIMVIAGPWPDLSSFGGPPGAASTTNPVQLAAQDLLALLTPQAFANFIASFVEANPDQACAFAVILTGVLGAGIAIETIGLPELVLAAQLAFYNAGLLEAATLADIVEAIKGAILEDCAKGLSVCGNITGFLKRVAGQLFLGETGGEWYDEYEDAQNLQQIIKNYGCGGLGTYTYVGNPYTNCSGVEYPPPCSKYALTGSITLPVPLPPSSNIVQCLPADGCAPIDGPYSFTDGVYTAGNEIVIQITTDENGLISQWSINTSGYPPKSYPAEFSSCGENSGCPPADISFCDNCEDGGSAYNLNSPGSWQYPSVGPSHSQTSTKRNPDR